MGGWVGGRTDLKRLGRNGVRVLVHGGGQPHGIRHILHALEGRGHKVAVAAQHRHALCRGGREGKGREGKGREGKG